MTPELWLPTRIWEYLVAVIWLWQAIVGGAFFCMQLVPIMFPSSKLVVERLDGRRVFLGLAMFFFVFANFQAFDQDQRDLRALRAAPAPVNWSTLPKSPAELRSGQPWNDGGVLAIVP